MFHTVLLVVFIMIPFVYTIYFCLHFHGKQYSLINAFYFISFRIYANSIKIGSDLTVWPWNWTFTWADHLIRGLIFL